MERISLWALGLLALGGQANFAAAVDPDGPALLPPGHHGPALSPPTADPTPFPAAVAEIAVEVQPETPEAAPTAVAPRLVHPAAMPVQRSHSIAPPVRPVAHVEAPSALAPDLLPGIPAALVPPAAIPQVAAPALPAAPRLAQPPRVPTAVQHVTCPKPEPAPVVHSRIATIQTVVEAAAEPVAYPPGQNAAPVSPAAELHLPPPPPAVAAPAPPPRTERATVPLPPLPVPEQPVASAPAPSAVKAMPLPATAQPQRMPAVEAIEPPPSPMPAPVVEALRPVQPAAAPAAVQPPQPYLIQPAAATPVGTTVPGAAPARQPFVIQPAAAAAVLVPGSGAAPLPQPSVIRPVGAAPAPTAPVLPRTQPPRTIQPVSAEGSNAVPAAVPVIEMPPPLEPVQVPAAVPIMEPAPQLPVQPMQPSTPHPVPPIKPATGGQPLSLESAAPDNPVQPRQSPYPITAPLVLNAAEPMPAGPPEGDTSPVVDDAKVPAAGEVKGSATPHHENSPGCCGGLWNSCCAWAGDGPTLTASTGFRLLKPYWKNNPAFFVADGATAFGTDFDFCTQFVPQFTLGAVGANGFGFRLGWWGFANQTSEFSVIPAGGNGVSAAPLGLQLFGKNAGSMAAAAKLRFDVWDIEATELLESSSWYFLLTGGLRYAHISQDYAAVLASGAGTPLAALASGHNFNGAGPTVSVTGKRPIGQTNLYVFGSARGSVLFGNAKQTAVLGSTDAYACADAVVPEAEFEIGLGYHRTMGRGRFFAQAGLIGDVWYEAGNSSRSLINPVLSGAPGLYNSADSNLGLLGLDLRLGVNY